MRILVSASSSMTNTRDIFGELHFFQADTEAKAKSFKIMFKCWWNLRLRAGSGRQAEEPFRRWRRSPQIKVHRRKSVKSAGAFPRRPRCLMPAGNTFLPPGRQARQD